YPNDNSSHIPHCIKYYITIKQLCQALFETFLKNFCKEKSGKRMIFVHTVFIIGLFLFDKIFFGKTNVDMFKFYKKNKKITANQCFPAIFPKENRKHFKFLGKFLKKLIMHIDDYKEI
ncbi:MAG: hypothetical protein E6677_07765, partial [Finegoldia magna]|nr:hypothetical protein [Finegoldia magna]